jgi:CRISPR-associated endoribonuclease Cas6
MRIRFKLTPPTPVRITWNHHYALSSALYATIGYASPGFSTFLHDRGFIADGKQFRLFTFSSLQGRVIERNEHGITMVPPLELLCSSPVPEFVRAVAEGALKIGSLRIEETTLPVGRVETLPDPQFVSPMFFKPLSPITASTGHVDADGHMRANYLSPDDSSYFDHLALNLLRKYEAFTGKPPEDKNVKFKVAENLLPKKGMQSKLIDIKGIKVRGWLVPVEGEGNPELLRLAYEAGLGEKNSVGFGMVEVANQNRKEVI